MIWSHESQSTNLVSRPDIAIPSPLPERYGVAIVAILKNKKLYIQNWLALHSIAGVRKNHLVR